jgi:chromosomal replication initiator protein
MNNSTPAVWKNCLSFIEDNIQPQAYKTWFLPIVPLKINDNVLNIQVPSKFFYEWLEEHYVKLLKTALQKELGPEARLVYSIRMENRFGNNNAFTEKIPSSNRPGLNPQQLDAPLHAQSTELKNPL